MEKEIYSSKRKLSRAKSSSKKKPSENISTQVREEELGIHTEKRLHKYKRQCINLEEKLDQTLNELHYY